MVTDLTTCDGCPHLTIVHTINSPASGIKSCRFALRPCDCCRQHADAATPKFKIGDKVTVRGGEGLPHVITYVGPHGYRFDGLNVNYFESSLELYTEPTDLDK